MARDVRCQHEQRTVKRTWAIDCLVGAIVGSWLLLRVKGGSLFSLVMGGGAKSG